MMVRLLVVVSMRTAAALDRAAMSVAYGEEAAEHYCEHYTAACGLRDWIVGFREGWGAEKA
jgi:hypothetical protein